jgi:hypothetical protein
MYGLPQAGILAYKQLVAHLAIRGYTPYEHTMVIWLHATHDVTFFLVVDDFGIQYTNRIDADHIQAALEEELYVVTTDWTGSLYLAIHMAWDYINHTIYIFMPGYTEKSLDPTPPLTTTTISSRMANASIRRTPPDDARPDDTVILSQAERTRIEEVIGALIFYGRVIDSTVLVALDTIAYKKIKGEQATAQAIAKLLNYASAHPDATVRYHTSGMCLHIHSGASHLSEANAHSRAGGNFLLSAKHSNNTKHPSVDTSHLHTMAPSTLLVQPWPMLWLHQQNLNLVRNSTTPVTPPPSATLS